MQKELEIQDKKHEPPVHKALITVSGNCPYIPEMRRMLADSGIAAAQADLNRLDDGHGLLS